MTLELEGAKNQSLPKTGLLRLLDELEGATPPEGVTLYLTPQSLHNRPDFLLDTPSGWQAELEEAIRNVGESESGAVLFWSQDRKLVVLPPFPLDQDSFHHGWNVYPLRELMAREYTLGVVMVRLGRYAVGVFHGNKLVASKTASRYVKGRHHAGGTSQKRFQRIREGQIARLYHKVCSILEEKLGPMEHRLDYIFLGGERFTLMGFLKECPYLQRLSPKILKRVLNVPEPSQKALLKAPQEIWRSQVIMIDSSRD